MVVGEFTQETDLVVIGGGPAGYSCAFRAAELGVQTVIVDAHPSGALGGVCLHDGCVPSKTLLHVADLINVVQNAELGVSFAKPKFTARGVREWKDKTIAKLAGGLDSLCKKYGVERIHGRAEFEDSRTLGILESSVRRLRCKRALIATGSNAIEHPILKFDEQRVWSPEMAMTVSVIPKSLLIVGSGYIAVEVAAIYLALGSTVTLVDEGERLLPDLDPDIARPLLRRLEQQGLVTSLKTSISGAALKSEAWQITFAGGSPPKNAKFDCVAVALGRGPNTTDLHLEKIQVARDAEGFIRINNQMRTNNPRIFAAGDVTGPPLLADRALHQGRIAAEVIAGGNAVFDARTVPATIFTDPQVAWCGMLEEEAKRHDLAHAVVKQPWGASGRAVGMGRNDGLTKIVYEPGTNLVLGVAMTGPHACEMIAEAALAIEMGATVTDLAATIHPHPTMSEMLSDAARLANHAPAKQA